MVMTFRYVNTTGSHRFDVDLGDAVVRLGSIGSGFVNRAEIGDMGVGGIEVDDPDGTLDIVGLQYLRVTESEAPAGSDIVWYGYIADRKVSRGDSTRASLRTGAARMWSIDLNDFNSILSMRLITSGNRPAESASARFAWLIGLSNCPFHDNGYVTVPSHGMDAVDYTDQSFSDVLADIVAPVSYNYWVDYDQSAGNIGLWMLPPGSTAYTSTAAISNVYGEADEVTIFSPRESPQAELTRSPSRVASRAIVRYNGGRVAVTNSTTLDTFASFDHVAPMSNVKTAAKATAVANAFLAQSDGESDRITCTVRVPAAHVNDIRAGHRIRTTFSHLPGYETPVWCRVASRTVRQDEETDEFYNLALELVTTGTAATALGKRAFAVLAHRDASSPLKVYPGPVFLPGLGWKVEAEVDGLIPVGNADGIYILSGPGTTGSPMSTEFQTTGPGNYIWMIGMQLSQVATGGEVAATKYDDTYTKYPSIDITTTGPGVVIACIRIFNFDSGTRGLIPPAGTFEVVQTPPNDTAGTPANPARDYGRMSVVIDTVGSAGTYTYMWEMSNQFNWTKAMAALFIPTDGSPAELQQTALLQVPTDPLVLAFPGPM